MPVAVSTLISMKYLTEELWERQAVSSTWGRKPTTTAYVSSSGALEDTFTLNFRFISQGSADNILTHILFHITITPNGDVTSEISNITDVCRG